MRQSTRDTDTTHPAILRDTAGDGTPANRVGRRTVGIYPRVSRTKLAEALGKKTATVSRYFLGLKPMPLDVAVRVAGLIGVGVQELSEALGRAAKRRQSKAKRNEKAA